MTTKGITDNAEESSRGERWVEEVVCRGLIIGFSPKSKGVFTFPVLWFFSERLKKRRRGQEIINPYYKEL